MRRFGHPVAQASATDFNAIHACPLNSIKLANADQALLAAHLKSVAASKRAQDVERLAYFPHDLCGGHLGGWL